MWRILQSSWLLLQSDPWVEVVGTLEDEYVSLSTGELQAVAWAPTLHMRRSILLSLIPMNINETIWSRASQISEVISLQTLKFSYVLIIAKYIKLFDHFLLARCLLLTQQGAHDFRLDSGSPNCSSMLIYWLHMTCDYGWCPTNMLKLYSYTWAIMPLYLGCQLAYIYMITFECFETCPSLLSGMCQS